MPNGWVVESIQAYGRSSMLHTAAAGHGIALAGGIVADRPPFETLIFQRGESGWQRMRTPSIGRVNRALVISETEAWAVGDGRSLHLSDAGWQEIATAGPPETTAYLDGLARCGAEIWAAGSLKSTPGQGSRVARGTVQRWDGARWAELPVPAIGGEWRLSGIDGVSNDDLWAVGAGYAAEAGEAVALHWDGRDWRRPAVPGATDVWLSDVVALATDNVWAAGSRNMRGGSPDLPIVVHWDGARWSSVDIGSERGDISELTTDGATVWGIGSGGRPGEPPLVVRLAGTTAEPVCTQQLADHADDCSLHGGAVLADGRLLVVGALSTRSETMHPAGRGLVVHAASKGPRTGRPFAAVLG